MAKTIEQGQADRESKTEDVRKLEKIEDNQFRLTITNEGAKMSTIKEFNKKQLREVYGEVKQNITNLRSILAKEMNKAKHLNVLSNEDLAKIEDFMFTMSQVAEYKDAEKAKNAIPNIEKQIKLLDESQKEISLVIPEVLRN